MDEIKLQRDVTRMGRAQSLLENELLNEAFAELEKSYIGFWRQTKAEDQMGREKLFLAVNVVGKVKEHLHKVIRDGRVSQADLNKLYADQERKKRFGLI